MFDIPIHPFIVHFPVVLSVFLPLAALAALIAGFRVDKGRKFWMGVLLVHALLVGTGFLAVQSGERDEEKVEDALVSEAPLESHAEKAEFFLKVAGVTMVLSALGLAPGLLGLSGRIGGGLASVLLLVLGMQVGHSGGQLVYKHGAATAYLADNQPADGKSGEPRSKVAKGGGGEGEAGAQGDEDGDDD